MPFFRPLASVLRWPDTAVINGGTPDPVTVNSLSLMNDNFLNQFPYDFSIQFVHPYFRPLLFGFVGSRLLFLYGFRQVLKSTVRPKYSCRVSNREIVEAK